MSQPGHFFRGQWVVFQNRRIGVVLNPNLIGNLIGIRCLVEFTDRDYPTMPLTAHLQPLLNDEEWT